MALDKLIPSDEKTANGAESPPKKPINKLLIFIPAGLLLLGVQTLAAYFTIQKVFFATQAPRTEIVRPETTAPEPKPAPPKAAPKSAKPEKTEEVKAGEGLIYQLEDIIVNPAGTLGRRYLVLSMSFEVSSKKTLEELTTKMPVIRDALISLLTSKSMEYVSDVMNLENLRNEIQQRANEYLNTGKVVRVFFTGYVLQ